MSFQSLYSKRGHLNFLARVILLLLVAGKARSALLQSTTSVETSMKEFKIYLLNKDFQIISDKLDNALTKTLNDHYKLGFKEDEVPAYEEMLSDPIIIDKIPDIADISESVYVKLRNDDTSTEYVIKASRNPFTNENCQLIGYLVCKSTDGEIVPFADSLANINICKDKRGFIMFGQKFMAFLLSIPGQNALVYELDRYGPKRKNGNKNILETEETSTTFNNDTSMEIKFWKNYFDEMPDYLKEKYLALSYIMKKESVLQEFNENKKPEIFELHSKFVKNHFKYPRKTSYSVKLYFLVSDDVVKVYHRSFCDFWISYIINEVDKIFQHDDLVANGLDIRISLEESELLNDEETEVLQSLFIEKGLESLMPIYGIKEKSEKNNFDIMIYLSKDNYKIKDIFYPTKTCESLIPIVSIKDEGTKTIFTLAQAIARALGVEELNMTSCNKENTNYLMNTSQYLKRSSFKWSSCSIAKLEKTSGHECLMNEPIVPQYSYDPLLGVYYSHSQQCASIFGPGSIPGDRMVEDKCGTLWCLGGKNVDWLKSRTNWADVIDGTICGHQRLCNNGICESIWNLQKNFQTEEYWGDWSKWSKCFKDCGPSMKYRTRKCNSLKLINGGRNCGSDNIQFKSCFVQSCSQNINSVFNNSKIEDYRKNRCNTWALLPAYQKEEKLACLMFCKMNYCDKHIRIPEYVPDGEPCFMGDPTSICIKGKCVKQSCRFKEDFKSKEGACRFNEDNYEKVLKSKNYTIADDSENYRKQFRIPKGARNIKIVELPTSDLQAANLFIHNGLRKKHVNINTCPQNEYYSHVHKGVLWQISGLPYKTVTAAGPLLRPVTVVNLLNNGGAYNLHVEYMVEKPTV